MKKLFSEFFKIAPKTAFGGWVIMMVFFTYVILKSFMLFLTPQTIMSILYAFDIFGLGAFLIGAGLFIYAIFKEIKGVKIK